jgi:hypothetical protein
MESGTSALEVHLKKLLLFEKLEDWVAKQPKSLNVKIVQPSIIVDGASVEGRRMAVSNGKILVTECELPNGQIILIPNLVRPR